MPQIRPPAVAGTFYPAHEDPLRRMIAGFLHTAVGGAVMPAPPPSPIKALIAPHAGYIYSGPIAGSAYACLRHAPATVAAIRRVVLLGTAHTMYVDGLAAPTATTFRTPLGDVPVDQETITRLLDWPQVHRSETAHRREHGLEVHLPFLQTVLAGPFHIIPLVVGDTDPLVVAELLAQLWGGAETLIIISSDLSHYHNYHTACQLDRETAVSITTLQPEKLGPDSACGRIPIAGLLHLARQNQLTVHQLDLRNSGDTAGPRDRVVGYGAWVIT